MLLDAVELLPDEVVAGDLRDRRRGVGVASGGSAMASPSPPPGPRRPRRPRAPRPAATPAAEQPPAPPARPAAALRGLVARALALVAAADLAPGRHYLTRSRKVRVERAPLRGRPRHAVAAGPQAARADRDGADRRSVAGERTPRGATCRRRRARRVTARATRDEPATRSRATLRQPPRGLRQIVRGVSRADVTRRGAGAGGPGRRGGALGGGPAPNSCAPASGRGVARVAVAVGRRRVGRVGRVDRRRAGAQPEVVRGRVDPAERRGRWSASRRRARSPCRWRRSAADVVAVRPRPATQSQPPRLPTQREPLAVAALIVASISNVLLRTTQFVSAPPVGPGVADVERVVVPGAGLLHRRVLEDVVLERHVAVVRAHPPSW